MNNLFYREQGNGTPLVFIHGYLGGGEQWQGQMQMFESNKFKTIAPCLPGFGDSANLTPPQSIGEFAKAVLDFLSAKNINRFFLLGHSMGGMIVQEMTRQMPESVAALILYGTGALGALPGRFETMAQSRQRVLEDGIKESAPRLVAKWLTTEKDSLHHSFVTQIANKATLAAHLAGLSAMESFDGRQELCNIKCPTLIVWGDADKSYLREQIDFLHNNIANADLKIIPNAPHLTHLEYPEKFNAIVRDFLNAQIL